MLNKLLALVVLTLFLTPSFFSNEDAKVAQSDCLLLKSLNIWFYELTSQILTQTELSVFFTSVLLSSHLSLSSWYKLPSQLHEELHHVGFLFLSTRSLWGIPNENLDSERAAVSVYRMTHWMKVTSVSQWQHKRTDLLCVIFQDLLLILWYIFGCV